MIDPIPPPPPPPPRTPPPLTPWSAAATALLLGAATACFALSLLAFISPVAHVIPAAAQGFKALLSGQSSFMHRVFSHELQTNSFSGVFSWHGAVRMNMLYAEHGEVHSFARLRQGSSRACELFLEIDGTGTPAMASNAFIAFTGRIQGTLTGLSSPNAAGAAFTVAHELGHCELGAQAATRISDTFTQHLLSAGSPLSGVEQTELNRWLGTPLGISLIHEGYADVKAAQALARRMNPKDFHTLFAMTLTYRSAATRDLQARAVLSRDDAHHTQYALRALLSAGESVLLLSTGDASARLALDSAVLGAITFFSTHPEARIQAHFSTELAAKIVRAGEKICQTTAPLGSADISCTKI